jgi:hypothetical protein
MHPRDKTSRMSNSFCDRRPKVRFGIPTVHVVATGLHTARNGSSVVQLAVQGEAASLHVDAG